VANPAITAFCIRLKAAFLSRMTRGLLGDFRLAAAPSPGSTRAAGAEQGQRVAGQDAGRVTGRGLAAAVALLAAGPPGVPHELVVLGSAVEIRDPEFGCFGGDDGVHVGLLGAVGVAIA
jgi:hypothetical protein